MGKRGEATTDRELREIAVKKHNMIRCFFTVPINCSMKCHYDKREFGGGGGGPQTDFGFVYLIFVFE